MWMLQNTQIFLSKYLYSFSLARSRAGCLKWDFVGFLKCKLKRVLVAANCRPGVKPLTSWQPPLVSQKCLCSTRSNSSTQGDLGEVSIIIFGMSQTWNFVKNFTPSDFQEKILHRQFHLILTGLVIKNTNNEWNGEIYTAGKKFYTAAGSDGSDKSYLW